MNTSEQVVSQPIGNQSPGGNNVAVIDESEAQLLQAVFGTTAFKEAHNFTGDQQEIWRQVARCGSPEVKKMDEAIGRVLDVCNFYAHVTEVRNVQSGKFMPAIRSVLICTDGSMYGCVSGGIAHDIARMVSVFGMRKFDPPLQLTVAQVPTRAGYRTLRLIPA